MPELPEIGLRPHRCVSTLVFSVLILAISCGGGSDGTSGTPGGGNGSGTAVNASLTGSFDAFTYRSLALHRFDAATGITSYTMLEEASDQFTDRIFTTDVSADGSRLYHSWDQCMLWTDCIVTTDLDGHELSEIFPVEPGTATSRTFVREVRDSPDGRLLLATAGRANVIDGTELFVMDTDGNVLANHRSAPTVLQSSRFVNPRWLPDGRIVYQHFDPDRIWIIDDPLVSTDATHRLLFEFRAGELHGSNNPRGFNSGITVNTVSGEIAFIWDGLEAGGDRETFDQRLYTIGLDGSRPREIAQAPPSPGLDNPIYSPDGRWLAVLLEFRNLLDEQLLIAVDTEADLPVVIDTLTDPLPEGVILPMTDCGFNPANLAEIIIRCGDSDIGPTGAITLINWF